MKGLAERGTKFKNPKETCMRAEKVENLSKQYRSSQLEIFSNSSSTNNK